jgi:hypothetical protein
LSDDLKEKLQRIEYKLDSINKLMSQYIITSKEKKVVPIKPINFDAAEKEIAAVFGDSSIYLHLLKLPDSLKKTMFAMNVLKEASSPQVAEVTGRTRSVESFHLNQLERMGYLSKFRNGRKIIFQMPSSINKNIKK